MFYIGDFDIYENTEKEIKGIKLGGLVLVN